MSTLRDVQSTRLDLLSNLQELGFVSNSYDPLRALVGTDDSKPTPGADAHLDAHSSNINMLKALILAGLWPSVVRIALPSAKYDQGSSGTIQRDAEARTVKYFDQALGRVFLHPSSTLFASASYSSSYLAIFQKSASGEGANSKVYMRDATEVPLYSLLLFGGKLKINHMAGGISVGSPREGDADGDGWVRMRANARIGVLCAQLRRLLDAVSGVAPRGSCRFHLLCQSGLLISISSSRRRTLQVMADAVEQPGSMLTTPENQDVVSTMIALITRDGLSAP